MSKVASNVHGEISHFPPVHKHSTTARNFKRLFPQVRSSCRTAVAGPSLDNKHELTSWTPSSRRYPRWVWTVFAACFGGMFSDSRVAFRGLRNVFSRIPAVCFGLSAKVLTGLQGDIRFQDCNWFGVACSSLPSSSYLGSLERVSQVAVGFRSLLRKNHCRRGRNPRFGEPMPEEDS